MKKFIFVFGLVALLTACTGAVDNKNVVANDSIVVLSDSVVVTEGDSTTVTTLGVDQAVIDSLVQSELGVE